MLQSPMYIYADNNGSGNSPSSVWAGGGGSGGKPASAAVFPTYGYKATITTPGDNFAMCDPLGDTYTLGDLEQQLNDMSETLLDTYFEPGSLGIHIYKVDVGMGKRFSAEHGFVRPNNETVNFKMENNDWHDVGNPLAWAIYENDGNNDYPYEYNEELANLFTAEGASACGEPMTWLNEVNSLYSTIVNRTNYAECSVTMRTPKRVVVGTFSDGNGATVADRFRYITWSTNDMITNVTEDPYIKALSSRLGLVAMDTVMALAALQAREDADNDTAREMANKIYAWITSDYDLDNMAMIMVESTSGINVEGNTKGKCDFVTLIDHIALSYGSHEILFGEWPEDCHGDTNKAFAWSTNGALLPTGWRAPFAQGIWGYPNGGEFVNDTVGGYYNGRGYLKTLNPYWTEKNVYGYILNWTYAAGGSNSNSNKNKNSMGSFTWQLNPSGVRDKTPDTEVNASSTIYNLNISQDGYNDNNYMTDWVPAVRQDTVDGNKLRIRIYHISENLAEDQQATEYARDAVKKQGQPVTTSVPKVTIGDGTITGIPKIGTLKNGEWLGVISDDDFLEIMKTATGLSYNETVAGSLVPDGVRVTYAIYIDYDIGCKNTNEKCQLRNDQAEWIEYRSIPGRYTFISDSPEGYAEIKSGYFSRDEGYYEPYEAMAGTPTTENLYFVSGGQDFVAQVAYEYVPKVTEQNPTPKDAIRNYEQRYSATQCEGYWTPQTKSFSDTPLEEIQAWGCERCNSSFLLRGGLGSI